MRRGHDRPRILRPAVDLHPGPGAPRGAVNASGAAYRGALRDRDRACPDGGSVRAGSPRRGDRVPQAPGLVREGCSSFRGPEATAARGRFARPGRGHLCRLPGSGAARRDYLRRSRGARRGRARGRSDVNRERVLDLLRRVAAGELAADVAADAIAIAPLEDLGFATIDHHRAVRLGFPEVILAAGKTTEQVVEIA